MTETVIVGTILAVIAAVTGWIVNVACATQIEGFEIPRRLRIMAALTMPTPFLTGLLLLALVLIGMMMDLLKEEEDENSDGYQIQLLR